MLGLKITFEKDGDYFFSGCKTMDTEKVINMVSVIKKSCSRIVDEEFYMQKRELDLLEFNEKEREERLCQSKRVKK